jgi:hypothetical protein
LGIAKGGRWGMECVWTGGDGVWGEKEEQKKKRKKMNEEDKVNLLAPEFGI